DSQYAWIVEEMPKAVAMPSSTGNEIRPRVGISALSTFPDPTVKHLRRLLAVTVDVHHPQHATRHRQDGPDPKPIARLIRFSEDAARRCRAEHGNPRYVFARHAGGWRGDTAGGTADRPHRRSGRHRRGERS